MLGGGAFILWTALKEIYHLLAIHDVETRPGRKSGESVGRAVTLIVIMNLVFSFDSILSAMALTKNFGSWRSRSSSAVLMMIWLADHVAEFLKKNRMYEVLGLFILFIVGVMLVSEGGHLAELNCSDTTSSDGQEHVLLCARGADRRGRRAIKVPEEAAGKEDRASVRVAVSESLKAGRVGG